MHLGQRVFDAWFFTSSKVSDSYTKIYSNRRKLNKLSNKSWSAHRFAYLQSEIYNYVDKNKIKNLIKNKRLLENNGYGKFLFSFISLKMFMDRYN